MKKIFAIALALIMVLGIATSAMAISWGAPTISTSASAPFTAEVIKLGASAGVTGYEYYTVINDAAAYNYSNIFYAIKLNIPSAAQANAAYSGAKYNVGDQIKVTINYTNVQGKSAEVKYVPIGASPKTLWYNGKTGVFEEQWVPSVSNACGCGDQHVIKAIASGTGEVRIRVCFAANGKLSDLKLAGCYSVEAKEYCGVKPCPNCKPIDIKGYKFSGECAKFPVFFSTNSTGRVTGAYVIDDCVGYTTDAYGSMKQITKELYGWKVTGPDCGECTTCTTGTASKFELVPLDKGTVLQNWTTWNNNNTVGSLSAAETYRLFAGSCGYIGSTVYDKWDVGTGNKVTNLKNATAYNTLYLKRADNTFISVANAGLGKIADDLELGSNLYRNAKSGSKTSDPVIPGASSITALTTRITPDTTYPKAMSGDTNVRTIQATGYKTLPVTSDDGRYMPGVGTGTAPTSNGKEKDWSKYDGNNVVYLETYYFCFEARVDQLFQQLTADRINCDTNDASYLNSLNHLYSVLGFTYADIMAGNVYMTDYILLSNFGFAIAPCGEAVWGAYTASITVAPVAEVPATGDVGFMGFLFIGLSAVATVVNRKRTNTK
ncbi:MAG: hypothetical protein Q4E65_06050 [Clostridia bacterium]|nr:hypothetical protein [Clostridia bacterium]